MKAYGGIGLSANQIGISKRFFLLATNGTAPKSVKYEDTVMVINPVIIDQSEEVQKDSEGCLSLPLFSESIVRPLDITVEFYDTQWKKTIAVFSGLEARCVLHEIEHLDGRLLLDRLSPMKQDMYKKKLQKSQKYGKIRP